MKRYLKKFEDFLLRQSAALLILVGMTSVVATSRGLNYQPEDNELIEWYNKKYKSRRTD